MCLHIKIHTKNQVVCHGSAPTAIYSSDRSTTITMSVWMLWPMQTAVFYICRLKLCFFFLLYLFAMKMRSRGGKLKLANLRR